MFTRNQIDQTDDSLPLFGVLDHLSEIRADQSGDSLNERQLDSPLLFCARRLGKGTGFVSYHSTTRKLSIWTHSWHNWPIVMPARC